MLVKSSNDAAVALGKAIGGQESMVSCMNRTAEEMELFDTRFDNESGLDIGSKPGAYGSAEDATQLLLKAANAYPDIFGSTRYESYNVYDGDTVYEAPNTNKVQSMIVGMKASKTGLTDLAGGNLVFEMDAGLGHSVMIAILGSSEDGRFEDALTLSQAVINYLGKTK
jgi:D-alanyl-D-alanine carboxypeptidase